jgi:C4-dicarboxylate-specific signal transduction histidine kinase
VSKRILTSDNVDIYKMINNIELIEMSCHRISKLVNGMKSLVRNSEADPFTNQSFENYLEIVKFLIFHKAEMRKVDFELKILTDDLNVFCRPTQLEQVLINLLNNAIDAAEFTGEKWVKLFITSDSNNLRFEVIDSGDGISESNLKKIWDPFFTTKDIGKGTGLGLAISHSIILENNGNIYYNKNNKNTSFVVEVPKLRQAA